MSLGGRSTNHAYYAMALALRARVVLDQWTQAGFHPDQVLERPVHAWTWEPRRRATAVIEGSPEARREGSGLD
ncbi:MAG: hypothetical protein AMXMBFR64_49760 [Myxococcales bacterium]